MQEEVKKEAASSVSETSLHKSPTKTDDKESEKEESKKKKGFFSRVISSITKSKVTEEKFNKFFDDLEVTMLENNVSLEVIERIKELILENLKDKQVSNVEKEINIALEKSIEDILQNEKINFIDMIKDKPQPCIIAFFGINGGGKTTTIAKIANLLKENGLSVVISASDTFRAAAIHQIEEHANRLKVKLVKHDYGADPTAVAFDTVKYAKRHDIDVVLIDTAGRVHSNINLIDELKKLVRVIQPHIKVFVGESISGNDLLEQVRKFDEAVALDGIILTKADVDEKGGSMISVKEVTKKPILFLGTGQEYKDLKPFDPTIVLNNLFNE